MNHSWNTSKEESRKLPETRTHSIKKSQVVLWWTWGSVESKYILCMAIELRKVWAFDKGQEPANCSILNPSLWNRDLDDGVTLSRMISLPCWEVNVDPTLGVPSCFFSWTIYFFLVFGNRRDLNTSICYGNVSCRCSAQKSVKMSLGRHEVLRDQRKNR